MASCTEIIEGKNTQVFDQIIHVGFACMLMIQSMLILSTMQICNKYLNVQMPNALKC